MAKADQWAITKAQKGPDGVDTLGYPEHKRSCMTYSQYISGFTEEEISDFMEIELREVKRDIQHIITTLPPRTIIQHNNDRQRIILQREEAANYNKLINDSLKMTANDFLAAGVSPASVLREYREAVGQTQKPEPLIQVNSQQNFWGQPETPDSSGISSAEDAIRKVLAELDEQNHKDEAIDIEPEDAVPQEDGEPRAAESEALD